MEQKLDLVSHEQNCSAKEYNVWMHFEKHRRIKIYILIRASKQYVARPMVTCVYQKDMMKLKKKSNLSDTQWTCTDEREKERERENTKEEGERERESQIKMMARQNDNRNCECCFTQRCDIVLQR